jgi:stage III sporulation protein AE
MRRYVLLLFFLLGLGGHALAQGPPAPGAAAEREALIEQQRQQVDTSPVDSFLAQVSRTWEGYGPNIALGDFLEVYRGGEGSKYAPLTIIQGLLRYLTREVVANTGLLAKILVLAVAAALLQHMQSAFESEATGKLAYAVVYLVLIGLAVTGFGLAVAIAKQVMETLSGFMLAILPALLTLLAGLGGITSAAIFHPIMMTLTATAATVMAAIVFPLIFLAAMLDIVSGLNENFKLTNLAGLFRQGAMYVLGLTSVIFLGTVAVKGAAGAVADGVTLKTAKFLFGSFIPVVGKLFADASDLIFGTSILLKNALGMAGAAAIFFIAAFPLLKILSLVLIYQLAGALVQPVGAGPIAKMLTTMARSLQLVFASVAVVALMFLVGITVIVGAGNLTVMVR